MGSGGGGGGGGGGGHGGGHKRHEEHEEHEELVYHEAWVIPYADMLTLLMVMFLALFATGRADAEKMKKFAESMRIEVGGSSSQVVAIGSGSDAKSPLEGGSGIFDGAAPPQDPNKPTDMQVAQAVQNKQRTDAQTEIDKLQKFEEMLKTNSNIAGIGSGLDFKIDGRGLVVTVLSDAVLFEPGSATLQATSWPVLRPIVEALKNIPNGITVEGHTDSRAISTSKFPSNWELSAGRATAVLKFFEYGGIDPTRMQVAGLADTKPVEGNDTAEGRAKNRRVEIIVLTDISLEPILGPDA